MASGLLFFAPHGIHLPMDRSLQIALGFLTIFKTRLTPYPDMVEVGRSAWAFPVIGAVIGIILVVAHALLSAHLPMALGAVLVVGIWIVLTGGLHLDGWTGLLDALFSLSECRTQS